MLIHIKDDIEFVTELPWYWDTLYNRHEQIQGNFYFIEPQENQNPLLLSKIC